MINKGFFARRAGKRHALGAGGVPLFTERQREGCFNGGRDNFNGNTNRGFHADALCRGEGKTIAHRDVVIAGDCRLGVVERCNDFKVGAVENDRQHLIGRALGRNTCVEGGLVWHWHDVENFQVVSGRRSEGHVKSPKEEG
ncbi:hypothetical protein TMES_16935 [Thalassospira mesophila]|uniref:Uncharacterized protein n=1 Tax=Thalassospira mesophila TaxID=1293891 RepID=A0A1Y2KWZ9_9PROT|nr:hypothetical protein TMES_16935 [Thalassospira mesophila]